MKNRWKQRHSGDYIRLITEFLYNNDIKNENARELFNKLVDLEIITKKYTNQLWGPWDSVYCMHNFSRTLAKRSKY